MPRPLRPPILTVALLASGVASPAWASGSGMPWEAPLQQVVDSITGPVAQAIAVLCVTVFGLSLAFAEGGSMQRRGLGVLFGLAVAFAAASFFMSFFGFAGGAVIG
ncbi:TrbC/VirB2 family protein [Phenylobacterium sp.]|uniref:TrbC/VirB2 family protein n=1 Tax=Phenylobacterium sp. TaxID=1871053 RepID=UPI002E356E90|nr:TrbC/VirB2 family protein [Phenylobacterium sp.]HEX2562019.1 TrbC/VirB2 family protein [Phenylobacterium sp.]